MREFYASGAACPTVAALLVKACQQQVKACQQLVKHSMRQVLRVLRADATNSVEERAGAKPEEKSGKNKSKKGADDEFIDDDDSD